MDQNVRQFPAPLPDALKARLAAGATLAELVEEAERANASDNLPTVRRHPPLAAPRWVGSDLPPRESAPGRTVVLVVLSAVMWISTISAVLALWQALETCR